MESEADVGQVYGGGGKIKTVRVFDNSDRLTIEEGQLFCDFLEGGAKEHSGSC